MSHEIRTPMSGVLGMMAMTANAMKGDKEKCIDAGMDDYISKPIDTDILKKKLYHYFIKKLLLKFKPASEPERSLNLEQSVSLSCLQVR